MTIYSAILFVHVVSALGIFSALSLETVTLSRLRQTTTFIEARRWVSFAPQLPPMAIGSLLLLLLSGGYMTAQIGGWSVAWPKVSLAALVLIAPLAAVTGRRMRAIRLACASANAAESELIARLQDPFLKFSLNIRIALALGIVLLMTGKPELAQCLEIIAGFVILGFASTLAFWRRNAVPPAIHAGSRQ